MHTTESKRKRKEALVVVGSVLLLILIFYSLNAFITKKNKAGLESNIKVVNNIESTDKTLGKLDSKVKIVMYSDFQCPACSGFSFYFSEVYKNIIEKYGEGSISLTFKHFPLISIHPNALLSAYSSEAAANQGKFWEMHDILFERQNEWANGLDAKSKIENYARELNLDMAKFISDRDSEEIQNRVKNSLTEAEELGLTHTPFVFINGFEIRNLVPDIEVIQSEIEEELQRLGVSPLN